MGRLTDIIAVLGIIGTSFLLVDKCENSGKSKQVKNSYDSLKTEYNNQHIFHEKNIKQRFGCTCMPEIGLEKSPLKLIGSYDYNKDGNLDCVYQDPKTKQTYLYKSGDNGHELSLIGEVNFLNNIQQQK